MKRRANLPLVVTSLLSIAILGSCTDAVKSSQALNKLPEARGEVNRDVCNHTNIEHYERLSPTLSKRGHIEYYYCPDCGKSFYDAACTQEIPNSNLGLDNKNDGRYLAPITGTFSLLKKNIRDYLSAKTDRDIILALRNKTYSNDQAERVIVWQDNGHAPYTVELSEDRDFTSPESFTSETNIFTFDGLFVPGETYYYRVKDTNNDYILDDCSFKIDDTYPVRTMRVEGVSNMRDIGGWTAKDGIKVPYGKFYRGGNLAGITAKGKEQFLGKLGIKTEIDLRRNGEEHQDIVDPRLSYYNYQVWVYTTIIPDVEVTYKGATLGPDDVSPGYVKNVFDLLANVNNYPFYLHCAAGADRTGTITYLLNGLLGVSFEDLTKDFELTTFSIYGDRYRSDVDEDTMTFTTDGVFGDFVAVWGKLNEIMMNKYGTGNGKLYSAIENYLLECGVTSQNIASIRYNMLGQTIDFSD